MQVKVVLVDTDAEMIDAWRRAFDANREVIVHPGSMLHQIASAWVAPARPGGELDGAVGAGIRGLLGHKIEHWGQRSVNRDLGGVLPAGHAVCTPTLAPNPRFVIGTQLAAPSPALGSTVAVALAAAGALQAVHHQNRKLPGSVHTVVLPPLGLDRDDVSPQLCADLMWAAYDLFSRAVVADFAHMRDAVETALADLGPEPSREELVGRIYVDTSVATSLAELTTVARAEAVDELGATLSDADW